MSKKGKDKDKNETIGEALIEQNKQTIALLEKAVKLLDHNADQNEAMLNLLSGIGRLQEKQKPAIELDPTELGKLPWQAYKKGNGSWIFSNTRGAEKLAQLIKESATGKIPIGEAEYRFSGAEHKFISRTPI